MAPAFKMNLATQSPQRVLVLDADLVPALAIARSLHRYGLTVDVASATDYPITGYSSATHTSFRYPDPLTDEQNFVAWLAGRVGDGRYALVIPVTERTVVPIASHRARFGATQIAIASDTALAAVLDKARTLDLAHTLGIPAPRTAAIEHIDQLDAHAAEFEFPVVIKPTRSFGARDNQRTQLSVDYAFNTNELRAKATHALRYGSVLLQEYVGGQGVGIELIADHGKIVYAFQHLRLHEVPLSGGGSSLRKSVAVDPALLAASAKLMTALAWHGVAMVEFKCDPASGTFSLMEINGRFWGSLPLAIAAGADFPAMLYELMVDGVVRPRPPARNGVYGRSLSRDLYWTELVLRREGPASLVNFPSRKQILKDALLFFSHRHHLDVQAWRDPRPGIMDIREIVSAQIKRVSRLIADRRLVRRLQKSWGNGEVSNRLREARQILFLCYGNINRSALAERCFKVRHSGMAIACISAGFHETAGRPADPAMIEVAGELGINLRDWHSHSLNKDMIDHSDIIFVMEQQHYQRIANNYPAALHRTFLLDPCGDIDDPYGKSPETYADCAQKVSICVERIAALLNPQGRA